MGEADTQLDSAADRLIALRGQRADIIDPYRLGDSRDDVGVGFKMPAQRCVEALIG